MYIGVLMCIHKADNEILFKKSLNALIEQKFQSFELLLIADGKLTQAQEHIIIQYKEFFNERGIDFKLIRNNFCLGHGMARNIGIKNMKSEIIVINDSDDISHSNRLEEISKVFKSFDEISIFTTAVIEKDILNDKFFGIKSVPRNHEMVINSLSSKCSINQQSVAIKRRDLLDKGSYITWFNNEDYFLWIRMLLQYPYAIVKTSSQPLVTANRDGNSSKRRGGLRYFFSESAIQCYLYSIGSKSLLDLIKSITLRFVIQVILPNKIRTFIYLIYRKIDNAKKV
tara:strand:- start:1220 stop:2071 length:852 start_codon:yes stop_codon:yes gene_type:complete